MQNGLEAYRRWIEMFGLTMSFGMLIWGHTTLEPHLTGRLYAFYWAACAAFAMLAVISALESIFMERRHLRAEHEELVRRTFDRIRAGRTEDDDAEARPGGRAEAGPDRAGSRS